MYQHHDDPDLPSNELFLASSGIPNLEAISRDNRLSDIDANTFPPTHEQRKAFTDNALMGLKESCAMFTARETTSELGTKSHELQLIAKMVMEMKN